MLSVIEVRGGLSNSASSSGGWIGLYAFLFLGLIRRCLSHLTLWTIECLGIVRGVGLHALLTPVKTMDVSMQSFAVLPSFLLLFWIKHRVCFLFFLCTLHYVLVLFLQEAPAVIESYYNKRIVGCPGGEGGKSVLSSPFYFSKVNSWRGVKHLSNKLLVFCLSLPAFLCRGWTWCCMVLVEKRWAAWVPSLLAILCGILNC